MEDDLKNFENGTWPQKMEDDFNFSKMEDDLKTFGMVFAEIPQLTIQKCLFQLISLEFLQL